MIAAVRRALLLIEGDDLVNAAPLLGAAGRLVAIEDEAIARLDRRRHGEPHARARERFHDAQRDTALLGVVAANQDLVIVPVEETVREPARETRAAFPGCRAG